MTQVETDPWAQRLTTLARWPRVVLVLPFLGFVVAFWMVSATPRPWVPLTFNSADKLMHAVAYAGLATWARVATLGFSRAGLWAFALAAGYGVVDEVHQSFVPGRSASVFDVAADATGAALAVLLIGYLGKKLPPDSSARPHAASGIEGE